jgi:cation diffusion facilitator CzcD-associated flavoprotein CzcO
LASTKCEGLVWDETLKVWQVQTNRGDKFQAKFVVMNFGTLTQPKLPGVPGCGDFQGKMFHTSRWDYKITGGTSIGDLHKLRNKRVAIIGTGATAIQAVPHLGANAEHLYVFQRTPSSVDRRDNRMTSPEFAKEMLSKPGWQEERMRNFTIMTQTPQMGVKDLIGDGWTKIMRNLQQDFLKKRYELMKMGAGKDQIREINKMMGYADMKQMDSVRQRCEDVVDDKKTADALKPWYQQFCKRPCFHDDYLPTFNRPNVELIHDVAGIERITKHGVVSRNQEYPVDCIVYATGFETGYNAEKLGPQKVGYDIVGKNGLRLSQKWSQGPRTFRSFNTSGFPNLFMQNSPQGTFTTNFVQTLDENAKHCAAMIARMRANNWNTFNPSKLAEDKYCEMIYNKSGRGQRFLQKCTPGYYNAEGKIEVGKTLSGGYPGGPLRYFKMLQKLRATDDLLFEGYDIQKV